LTPRAPVAGLAALAILLLAAPAAALVEYNSELGLLVHVEPGGGVVVYSVEDGALRKLAVLEAGGGLEDAQAVSVAGEAFLAACGPGGLGLYRLPGLEPAASLGLPCVALDFPAALVYEGDTLVARLYMVVWRGGAATLEPMASLYVSNAVRYGYEDIEVEPLDVVYYLDPLGVEAVVRLRHGGREWLTLALYLPFYYAERIVGLELPWVAEPEQLELCSLEPSPDRDAAVALLHDRRGGSHLLLLLPSIEGGLYIGVSGPETRNVSWAGWLDESTLLLISSSGRAYLLEPLSGSHVDLNVTLNSPPGPCSDAAVVEDGPRTLLAYEDVEGTLRLTALAVPAEHTEPKPAPTTITTTAPAAATATGAPEAAAPAGHGYAAAALVLVLVLVLILLLL